MIDMVFCVIDRPRKIVAAAAALAVLALMVTLSLAWQQQPGLDELVGEPMSAGHYREAGDRLRDWNAGHADSADGQFYAAWLALAEDDAASVVKAIERAKTLGLDRDRVERLSAIGAARSGKFQAAEPILKRAFDQKLEPRAQVAESLARIYLRTYRLAMAKEPLERWKSSAPSDPQPYLWSNEIASRSEAVPQVLIRNCRAALERDPNLVEARLELAKQLTKDGQFEEAEREFNEYLKRKPDDVTAMVGLGRNAFEAGDLDAANRHFEAALKVNPRTADALKDLALADTRAGNPKKACERYKVLVELEPFDFEIRYAYAQASRLSGDETLARRESELAAQLRKDNDRIFNVRQQLLSNPNDITLKYEAARWMLDHGHETEALDWTKEILRVEPRHAPTHAMLVTYYEKHGNTGLANYHRLMTSSDSDKGTASREQPAAH
jgi:tetratricopeptide (TPR) repeat protein